MGTSSSGQDGISIFHFLPPINYNNNKKTQTKFMKQLKKYSEKQKKEETLAKNLRTRRLTLQQVSYFFCLVCL